MEARLPFLTLLLAAPLLLACGGQRRIPSPPLASLSCPGPTLASRHSPTGAEAAFRRRAALSPLFARARRNGRQRGSYRTPSSNERRALRSFASSRFQSALPEGFELHRALPDLAFLWRPDSGDGFGAYLLRRCPPADVDSETAALELIVEVPHSFYDRLTLQVGLGLFEDLGARALLANTIHRRRGANCGGRRQAHCPSDVTRNPNSAFQAVHSGLLDAWPRAVVLAVHGYHPRPAEPDLLLSAAGTHTPLRCVRDAFAGLSRSTTTGVFPEQVHRLGGLQGVQSRELSERNASMIHLELGPSLRQDLATDEDLRRELSAALHRCFRTMGSR